MNWELFAAFFVITAVLIIVPGPIVTLVIATGASRGIRPALSPWSPARRSATRFC